MGATFNTSLCIRQQVSERGRIRRGNLSWWQIIPRALSKCPQWQMLRSGKNRHVSKFHLTVSWWHEKVPSSLGLSLANGVRSKFEFEWMTPIGCVLIDVESDLWMELGSYRLSAALLSRSKRQSRRNRKQLNFWRVLFAFATAVINLALARCLLIYRKKYKYFLFSLVIIVPT